MIQHQPFEFPFKNPPRTLFLSGQTNRTLLCQKIISLFAQTEKAPQRSKSLKVYVYRPIRFDRATAKVSQNQWGGEKTTFKKIAQNIPGTNSYFLESLKNIHAKLDAKNEIVSAHPQALQDTIPFLASNFPSLKAVFNGRVFRVSSKTIFSEPPPEPTKTVSEHNYEHTPTNCIHTNFPFSTFHTFEWQHFV